MFVVGCGGCVKMFVEEVGLVYFNLDGLMVLILVIGGVCD